MTGRYHGDKITESFEYQYRYQYIANCLPVGGRYHGDEYHRII